ncbi:MAG: hypothetical protein U0S13_06740 [Mycobacterium sp.]
MTTTTNSSSIVPIPSGASTVHGWEDLNTAHPYQYWEVRVT